MIRRSISSELRSHRCQLIAAVLVVVILLSMAMCAQPPAQPTPPAKPITATSAIPAQPTSTHEITAADVSAFIDGILPAQLAREDIAGAVVLIVKDGKVLFAKGYGYADVAKKAPVLPDSTLFRPASISKLFTWTAVMQQVEQGKLDLDRNVNDYLDFEIPATYPKPITLRNLMTHTPGFEETAKDSWVGSASDLKPLGDYLKAHVPARIYPPGTIPAYSNYGAALAGYIVQQVSGQGYNDYIAQHIFLPLGMMHSTFREPLPKNLKPFMSNGYILASEPPKPFEMMLDVPAGSSSVTAMDISRFMIMHLQNGKYENVQILRPETAQLMHGRQFVNLPEMNAMALGFYEETRNGHRIIGHGGDLLCFHSDLHLILDAGVGFFVSYNSMGKGEIRPRTAVWHAFLDRYFPYMLPPGVVVANAAQDAKDVSGSYLVSRRFQNNILSISTLLGEAKVSPGADNTLIVSALKNMNGKPKRFREIGPLLFRDINDQDLVGFKRDDSGRLVMVIDFPFMVFQHAYWYQSSAFNLTVMGGALMVLALTLLLWPIIYFVHRHYGRTLNLSPRLRRLRVWTRVLCAVDLVFVITFAIIASLAEKYFQILSSRMDLWLHLLQIVGWLGVLGTVLILWNAIESWRDRERGNWSRLGDTLIVLAAVGFSWFVVGWNMLHWALNY